MQAKALKYVFLAIFGLATATASANAMAAGNARKISGTWEIHGTPDPNACGVSDFVNLASITRHGAIVNVDPEIGTGVGETYRINAKTYAAGFFGFINTGQGILRYEVQGTLTVLNRGELGGVFRAQILDPAGNLACEYEGSLAAYRLVPASF